MKNQLPFTTPSLHFLSFLFLLFIHFPSFSSTDLYTTCGNTFNCGGITGIDYPFWGGDRPKQCGHPKLQLNCNNNFATITILNVDYHVLHIDQINQILTVKRSDLGIGDICPAEFISTNIDTSLFEYASGYVNLTIQYGCPPLNIPVPPHPACIINGVVYNNNYIVPGAQGSGPCRESIVIPVLSSNFGGMGELMNLGKLIEGGFEARWKVDGTKCNECENSGGRCGFDLKWKQFACFCPESDQLTQGSYKTCSPEAAHPLTSATSAYSTILLIT